MWEGLAKEKIPIVKKILQGVEKSSTRASRTETFATQFSLHYEDLGPEAILWMRHSPLITKTVFGFDIDPRLDDLTGQGAWDGSTPVTVAFMLRHLKPNNMIVVIGPGPYGGEAVTYSKETGSNLTALEINKKYLKSAKMTAENNKVHIKFIHADLFTPFSSKDVLPKVIDYFIWNPPYLDSETVKKYNLPVTASGGGPTGKELIQRALIEFKKLSSEQQKAKLAFCINTQRHKSNTIKQIMKKNLYDIDEIFQIQASPCKVFVMKLSTA